ncbi:MAG: zinc-ribbon domain-containing protein [Opitutaceae bacterium]
MNNVCVKCGEPLVKDASFCGACGAAVVKVVSPPAMPSEPKPTTALPQDEYRALLEDALRDGGGTISESEKHILNSERTRLGLVKSDAYTIQIEVLGVSLSQYGIGNVLIEGKTGSDSSNMVGQIGSSHIGIKKGSVQFIMFSC